LREAGGKNPVLGERGGCRDENYLRKKTGGGPTGDKIWVGPEEDHNHSASTAGGEKE